MSCSNINKIMQYELMQLPRTSTCSNKILIISNYATSPTLTQEARSPITQKSGFRISTFLHSLLTIICPFQKHRWLTIPNTIQRKHKIIGTLFGNRRGHVSFSVQDDPRSAPIFLIRLGVTTASLVREMSSGLVRIALESDKSHFSTQKPYQQTKLFNEPAWSMYCNGRKCGYAMSRTCTESDRYVLSTVSSVGAGAGVIPMLTDGKITSSASEGELMYMRARFERVAESRDSEAFYMMNPDNKNAGPDLSISLHRI